MMKLIKDIYPNKGQFLIDDTIEVVIEFESIESINEYNIEVIIIHIDEVIVQKRIDSNIINDNFIKLDLPYLPVGGYGLEIIVYKANEQLEKYTTAFDIAMNHKASPRYGFLSDFSQQEMNDSKDIISMKKLHINMVQFYDWMYRHEDLISPYEEYTDLMGKKITKTTIHKKIDLCHQHGMKAIAYGAIYAASEAFYKEHPDWALYDSSHQPITFIDIFYIMNIENTCPWHQHIIDEYKKAIKAFNFDGIHMDTYGFPKKAFSKNDNQMKSIELDKKFPSLINHTKQQLAAIKNDTTILFNNVGNWPVYSTAMSTQDMIYIEVWDPYNAYDHIQRIIHEAKNVSNKPIILAAYLKPFMNCEHKKAGYALKLLTAAIVANGAYHLIMGEDQGVLTQGYYGDYYKLENNLYTDMRKYYDFMIRYLELFYDETLVDVSMTHAYGDNKEYVFERANCSPYAEANKLWTIIKENKKIKLISLVNLQGNDALWNVEKEKPIKVSELIVNVQIDRPIQEVFITSPETQSLIPIPYTINDCKRGKVLSMTLNDINIWQVVLVKVSDENFN